MTLHRLMRAAPVPPLLAVLLAFLIILCGNLQPALAQTFADVPPGSYSYDAIDFLNKAGVVSGFGDGSFRPQSPVTRGQAAKILVEQHGVLVSQEASGFRDADGLYGGYVQAAAGRGWVSGYPDGTFRPYDSLQRQHMAVLIVRTLGLEDEAAALKDGEIDTLLGRFNDRAQVSAESERYVALAVKKQLLLGDGSGNLMPRRETSRAHFCLVTYRGEIERLAVLDGVRYSAKHLDKTRVVLDLSNAPGAISSRLNGTSLVVEVAGAVALGPDGRLPTESPEVSSVTTTQGSYRPPLLRATVDLSSYSGYEVFAVTPSDGLGHRVVIDVFRKVDYGGGKPVVVLDAGHGGSDTGAIGVTGVLEKEVNLAITLEVERYLIRAGLSPLMTRRTDIYPSLEERVDLANSARADVFVSIHNNAASEDTKGTETFYWGDEEGYSVEGRRLAESIQQAVCEELATVDRGARLHWKSLYVLANTDMPAALVEVGFLTNAEEEARLNDPAYRSRAAKAIAQGIVDYFELDYVFE